MPAQETNKNTLLAKSGSVPSAANVVQLDGFVLLSPKVSTGEINAVGTGALGNKKGYVDPNNTKVTFDIPTVVKASTALGVAPELSELYKIAGLYETITAGTKVEYKPGGITYSGAGVIKVFNDGYSRTVNGAAANMKISGKVGAPLKTVFSVSGYTTPQAAADPNPAVTLNSGIIPIISKITAITVGGVSINCDSVEFDMSNDVQDTYATGLSEFYIANFDPSITLVAIKTKGTDEQSWIDMGNGLLKAILITVGDAGAQIVLGVPNAFALDLGEADEKGRVKLTRKFRAENGGVANNNFSITYQ